MPLPSFIERLRQRASAPEAEASPLSSADIEMARARARRRLVGMVVLVGAGVVGFPWLFETQPRPMSSDVQVVSGVSLRSNAQVAVPSGPVATIAAVTAPTPPRVSEPLLVRPVVEEPAPVVAVPVASAVRPSSRSSGATSSHPANAPPERPVAKLAAKPSVKPEPSASAASAKKSAVVAANKPSTAASKSAADAPTRYVIQIGAFSEGPASHEVRMKVERAGIKTYTQVVTTESGKKVRVRIGPYASKAEADKAMATLKKAGLSGALLTL